MKGIKCTSNEVNAILAGDKSQIRLVIKPSSGLQSKWASVEGLSRCPTNYLCEIEGALGAQFQHPLAGTRQSYGYVDKMSPFGWFKCPHQVGDLVFVKESFFEDFENNRIFYDENFCQDTKTVTYLVEGEHGGVCEARIEKLKPAHYMKQHQSRITLRIKDISVERLQSISCAGYFKETGRRPIISHMDLDCDTPDPRNDFADYWNATHKKPEEKWEANCWVWKIELEVVK